MPEVKEFCLADIAELHYGNKFDKNKMTHVCPTIRFVSRTSANNGISDIVDEIAGVAPYPSGCVTLAFGGSIGSCFLQEEPFYTGQNVGVVVLPSAVSREAKLYFIATLEKVCKAKYVTFSDEINKHFKTDLSVTLPVKKILRPDWDSLACLLKNRGERYAEYRRRLLGEIQDWGLIRRTDGQRRYSKNAHQRQRRFGRKLGCGKLRRNRENGRRSKNFPCGYTNR